MIFIKFIFPQNYNYNSKILGIIDYQTAILNIIWIVLVYLIINFIFTNLNIKIFLFIIFVLPILILSIVGVNGENILNVIIYMSKFIFKQKLIFYGKNKYHKS